jgi:hypothetical protein
MLLAILLTLSTWALPPVDLPGPAYPATDVHAAMPWTPLNLRTTTCQAKPTTDAFWIHCVDQSTPQTFMMCSWVYADADPYGSVADWSTSCNQYGGNAGPPFFCRVAIFLTTAQGRYDCKSFSAPGIPARRWDGWVDWPDQAAG